MATEEEKRLDAMRVQNAPWRNWGPYLSERQWGTVREDYSESEDAWNYLTHDQARSKAYRWGEDGIAGISDARQRLCFALALWNGNDPILKERLFGLTGSEGNHGEDVKEYYFYLDNVPTHAYMKYLYKYPQGAYPYADLVEENKRRSRFDFEYELLDTGIFNEDCYFDVFIEYAKASEEDILVQISAANRGKRNAPLHLLPTLWFRNTWDWGQKGEKPKLSLKGDRIEAVHPLLGTYFLYADPPKEWLFTENETNRQRLYNAPNQSPYIKDAFHEYVIQGNKEAVNPQKTGTKTAAHFIVDVPGGSTKTVRFRLCKDGSLKTPFGGFEKTFKERKNEADAFYKALTPFPLSDDMRNVQRQAFAGMLWNKQYYEYNVERWLKGDPGQPLPPEDRKKGRNSHWKMLNAANVFSMPDKWEYPWFAAWDLAFHTLIFAIIDPDFAKHQLLLLTKEWYMHPNGQIPAYEWDFGDVNPPVHAWVAFRIYQIEEKHYGRKDRAFLEEMFQKLCLNFTWWVNRKDVDGKNIFEGGFLGLDNISAFDRTRGIPGGGRLLQADGTGWMGMYCLNLLQIALELAIDDPVYDSMAAKFLEHFIFIADALNNLGADQEGGLWDEKAGFYYGHLVLPDGQTFKMKAISLVGLIPIFAVATSCSSDKHPFPEYRKRFQWFMDHRPDLVANIVEDVGKGAHERLLLCLADPDQLRRMLEKILDEEEMLSPHGIRAVSKRHALHPLVFHFDDQEYLLDYEPAESTTPLFGGNSNWRGPVWFPPNYLLIESLQKYHFFLGDEFKVECPKGSGCNMSLWDVSQDLSYRLIQIFLKDKNGRRPLYGGIEKFQTDLHWKDYILFHEYYHGDNGAGLGASAQTGWTGLVAKLILQHAEYVLGKKSPEQIEKRQLGTL